MSGDAGARLARWLLQLLDRTDGDELLVTHELISRMLAVRRTIVTGVALKFQDAGLVRYRRGRIAVLDRSGLERAACECYRTIRRRTDAVDFDLAAGGQERVPNRT